MDYKLIVADFDGTLHCGMTGIPEGTAEIIKKYQAAGGKFAICTGRMLDAILPHAKELGISGDMAANQGSVIYSLDEERVLVKGGLKAEFAAEILKYLEANYKNVHLYIDGTLYVKWYDISTRGYEQYCGIKAVIVEENLSDFMLKNGGLAEKLLVLNDAEKNAACLLDLENRFGKTTVVSSSSSILVEIADLEFSKGKALEFLAKRYQTPICQTLAIGDSLNDLKMLESAGHSVAVGNAFPIIKQMADEVTVDCCDGAVREIIKKYGLKGGI